MDRAKRSSVGSSACRSRMGAADRAARLVSRSDQRRVHRRPLSTRDRASRLGARERRNARLWYGGMRGARRGLARGVVRASCDGVPPRRGARDLLGRRGRRRAGLPLGSGGRGLRRIPRSAPDSGSSIRLKEMGDSGAHGLPHPRLQSALEGGRMQSLVAPKEDS